MDKAEADTRLGLLINRRSKANDKIKQIQDYAENLLKEEDTEIIEGCISSELLFVTSQLSTAISSIECGCESAKSVLPTEFLNKMKHFISLLEDAAKEAEELENELQGFDI